MKKTNRMIAGVLAAVMGLASLPILSASAAEAAYVQGDVDLDGVITGHDSAVVSRSLYVEGASLTEEQAKIADMDGDGVIDQTDLEAIHAKEVYMIGDFSMVGDDYIPQPSLDVFDVLLFCSSESIGLSVEIVPPGDEEYLDVFTNYLTEKTYENKIVVNQVRYNLMDTDGDGDIDETDCLKLLKAASSVSLGGSFYGSKGNVYHLYNTCSYTGDACECL